MMLTSRAARLLSPLVLSFAALLAWASPAAAQTYTISGTVTVGGAPLVGATGGPTIQVYRFTGTSLVFVTSASVNSSGAYVTPAVSPNTYYLRTSNTRGLVDEAFGGSICINGTCSLQTTATPIVVDSANLTGKDFDLAVGGRITGTVTRASNGVGVQNVSVFYYTSTGSSLGGGPFSTTSAGVHTSGWGVPNGTYFAKTVNSLGLVDQLYSGITCIGSACNAASTITTGTPITVASGNDATVNFSLATGGSITGTLTSASGGAAIVDGPNGFANVSIYNSAGVLLTSSTAQTGGVYTTFTGLPTGNYFVRTSNTQGFIDVLHSGIPCPGGVCTITSGTAIAVTAGATTTQNFSLELGGEITGVVTRTDNSQGVSLSVQAFDAAGTFITSTASSASAVGTIPAGTYRLRGLPTGSYFVRTFNNTSSNADVIDELHNNLPCVPGCTVTTGTAVPVVASSTLSPVTVNFALDKGGTIQGQVEGPNGEPIAGATVSAINASGSTVRTTTSAGAYQLQGLPAGNYFVRLTNSLGFINEVYNNKNCINCSAQTIGDAVAVTLGGNTSGINFSLALGGRVVGTVTNASGTPISGVTVSVYDASGFIASTASASNGTYAVGGLPAGTYFAKTTNSVGLIDQLYSGTACIGSACNATSTIVTGTAITVTAGSDATANFALAPGGSFQGTIRNADGNTAISGVGGAAGVQVYNSAGTFLTSVSANASGAYQTLTGLPTGAYFIRSTNTQGFIDQLHNGIACPNGNCTVTTGTLATVTAGSATTQDFTLALGGEITGVVTRSDTSAGVNSVSVQAYNAAGVFVSSTSTSTLGGVAGTFRLRALPSGDYYVRTSNSVGFVDELHNNLPCVPSCTVTTGTAVPVVASSTLSPVTLNFALELGASIGGSVLADDASSTPITLATISAVNAAGSTVRSASPNSSGAYTITGLPAGTYYLRSSNSSGYLNEVWNNQLCVNCTPSAVGTGIAVALGDTVTGKNFLLSPGGRVSGTVTDTGGTPLAGIVANVYGPTGNFYNSATSAADGTYTVVGLPTGLVYVRTSNSLGYLDKLHSGIPCVSCSATAGTPVAVTAGATTTGINFSLAAGGRISGTISNAVTSAPIQGASVSIYNSLGGFIGSSQTNAQGLYTSGGLPAGNYFVTVAATGMILELYNDIVCPNCGSISTVVNGTSVPVTIGVTTTGTNFALQPGGTIAGTVSDGATTLPVSGANISIYNASNQLVVSGFTSVSGGYALSGLPSGTYYVKTNGGLSFNYLNQVYKSSGNLLCNNCDPSALGTPLTISTLGTPTTHAGINFPLAAGGSVSGTVVDGSSGNAAIANLNVQAYDSTGAFVKSSNTNAQGAYVIAGLVGGSYYLRTSTSLYVNQVFDGLNCTSCTASTGTAVSVTTGQTTTGKNFSLTAGGKVAGTITSGATPLAGVSVSFFTTSGASAGSATTDASGVYLSGAMLPGTYYARTSNSGGFINEVYNNLPCVVCSATSGAPIAVTAGNTTSAINFDLAAGGKIGGTVTDAGTGEPLPGANVSIYTNTSTFVTSATANDAGVYVTTAGLQAGTYYVRFSATGYVPEVYNNIACSACSFNSGAGVAVASGATTSGINAALALGGRITGRVTDGTAGVEAVTVFVYDKDSTSTISVASGTTSASGAYALTGLPAGRYSVKTSNSIGLINEFYNDITCATCSNNSGATVTVTAGTTTADIDFALVRGGRISGIVRGPGDVPLSGVSISVYNGQNQFVISTTTTQLGTYVTGGLQAGRYYVKTTFNSGNFINQLYNGIACRTCSANTGAPVDVTGSATTENINFTLVAGGAIAGTVRDSSNAPLANVSVRILDVDNFQVTSVLTLPNGTYSVPGLSAGTYYARTSNSLGLIDRIYNNVVCVFCSVTAGAPITVTVGNTAANIDFALGAGGGISGTVIDGSSAPLAGVTLNIYGSNGEFVQSRTTDALGNYATTIGLTPGNYYVRTTNTLGFIDEVYNNVVCILCNPRDGAPVAVTAGTVTTAINFTLTTGGVISGTVTDSGGAGIDRVTVTVHTAAGLQAASGITNAAGTYRTGALPAGTYYVRTRNGLGYTDEVYNDRECSNCNPTLGNAVTVTGDTTTSGIDFALTFGGRISGTVSTGGGAGIGGVTVRIVTAGGIQVTSGLTDASGNYTAAAGLPTGTYYAQTSNGTGYVDRIYSNVDCLGCLATVGTPIAVTAGSPTTGINFTLTQGGRISGTITDGNTSQPIASSFANVYSSTGVFVTQAVAGSSGQFITATGLAPGNYFVRAASRLGYISKVWNNINCASCSPIVGTPVAVTADTTTANINFALVLGGKLSGVVTDSAGAPLRNITMETFDASNNLVTTSSTDAAGQFMSASGLPVGTYFVRTRNNQGYIDEVYNNVTCIGGCQPNSGTGVVIGAGAEVTGIDFSLATGGKISGTITLASNNAPLSGVEVKVYDSAKKVVSSALTDSAGGYVTFGGLPAGTYYVRTDNEFGFLDEVFDNTPCIACDPRLATGVAVSAGATTANINFALAPGGGISGKVIAGDTSLPLGNVQVALYNASGSLLGTTATDAAGNFGGSGLAAGTYYLRTFNLQGYVDEAFDNAACAPCNILSSTAVVVTAGQTTANRNFTLAKGGLVSGYVTDSVSNAPLVGVTVSFYQVGTTNFVGRTLPTDEAGYYAISLPVGTYTAVTDAVNGYASSGTSSRGRRLFSAAGTVGVTLGQETSGVTFGLAACTPPAFSITAVPNGRVGVPFQSGFFVTASGGTGSLEFTVSSGTFTPGLTLATSGLIAGTPTVAGTSNFTLGVEDSVGCTATQEFAQTVSQPLGTTTVSPVRVRFGALRNGAGAITSVTAAQNISLLFSNGSPSWTLTKTDLDWLQLSSASGTGAASVTLSVIQSSSALVGKTSASGTITVTGPELNSKSIPVEISFDLAGTSTAPIGQVDTPTQNATGVQGAIGVTGWVLDNIGVSSVKIYRNCLAFENQASCQVVLGQNVVYVGDAAFLAGARSDVEAAFSTYPENNRAGWGYLLLTSMLPHVTGTQNYGGQGALTLYAVATDVEGNQKMLGRSSDPASADFATPTAITMANDAIAKPFGAIDTPAQGGTVSGVLNNFGWALTPDTNTTGGEGSDILIPTNGSTMTVFIDGLPTALVSYNQCRGSVGNPVPSGQFCNDDVANIFGNATPQAVLTTRTANATRFRNLDAGRSAIGAFTINTTTLSNGLHTIAWSVTDSAGRTEGIGSRFFNVLNSGADMNPTIEVIAAEDRALRGRPAESRGHAAALAAVPVSDGRVWFRTGFDLATAWNDLPADDQGVRRIEVAAAGRVELWLGAPVEGGFLVANDTLRDLPVGASVQGAQFVWTPPVGYVGEYRVSLIRGGERVEVTIVVR